MSVSPTPTPQRIKAVPRKGGVGLWIAVLKMKEIHKLNMCLIYGKWHQHIVRYWLLVDTNGYHHIIWKRVSSYVLLCCEIVENVCTLVRGEEV